MRDASRRHALVYLAAESATVVVTVVVARALGAGGLGQFVLLALLSSGLVYVHGLNAGVGAYRAAWGGGDVDAPPDDADGERSPPTEAEVVLGSAVVFTLLWTAVAVAAAAPFAGPLAEAVTGSEDNDVALLAALALPGVMAVWRVLSMVPRMELRPGEYAAFAIARGVLGAAAGLAAFAVEQTLAALMLGYLAGHAVGALALAVRVRDRVRYRLEWPALQDAVRLGLAALPAGLGAWALFALDRYVLFARTDASEVGLLGASFRFAMVVLLVDGAYRLAQAPLARERLRRGEPAPTAAVAREHTEQVLVLLGVATAVSLLAPYLDTVLGGGFEHTGTIVPLFAFGLVLYGAYYRTLGGAGFGRKLAVHVAIVWGGVALIALGSLVLAPAYGARGGGVAALLGYAAMLAAVAVLAARTPSARLQVRPLATAGAACVALVALVEASGLDDAAGAAARGVALLAAAGAVGLALRHVARERA